MRVRALLIAATAATVAIAFTGKGSASSAYSAALRGTEVPPISSTLGTFVGVATSPLRSTWRVQIEHEPLATGTNVAITGGHYSFLTLSRHRITGTVVGGSVTVTDRGSRCTDQTYRVEVDLADGTFDGTLTHHRRSVLHRCVLYAATITGRATLTA